MREMGFRETEQERLRVAARKLADGIPLSEAELRATKAALLSDWPGEGGGATEERSFREQEAQLGADRDAFYGFGASPARHSASPARHGASRFTEPSWSSSWVDASPAPFASGGGVRMPGSRPTPPRMLRKRRSSPPDFALPFVSICIKTSNYLLYERERVACCG